MGKAPSASGQPHAGRRVTLPLSFIIFFSVLNGIMFNVAVPDIAEEFNLVPSAASWVMTGYIVMFAVGTLVYGKLADLHSVRMLITVGLILLNTGSLMGLLARYYPMLVAARVLQACGGSAIPALAMIVATRYFPAHLRGSFLGVIASTVALAAGVGPVLGGFISGFLHWRYLFVFTLLTVFTIPTLRRHLPGESAGGKRFDRLGAALIGAGVALLLFSVTEGVPWLALPGAGLIVWFILHIRRSGAPFVEPALFLNRRFRSAMVTTFLSMGTVFGMLFAVPIMLRDVNALSSDWIGLVMFPGAMAAALLGAPGGRLSDRKGSGYVAYLGMGLITAGFLLLSTFAGEPPWVITVSLLVSYGGFAFIQSSLPHTVSATLPGEHTGVGMGIYNMFFFISGAFSAAAMGRLLDAKKAGFCLNPLNACGPAWKYSNAFILLAFLVIAAWALFCATFKYRYRV